MIIRPGIYFNETTLYINKGRNRTEIPLEKVISAYSTFFNLSLSKYFSTYKIKYWESGKLKSVTLIVNSIGNPMPNFIDNARKRNPLFEH